MIDKDGIKEIRGEIRFFMEKSFQVAFVYVGAIAAILFTTKMEAIDPLSSALGVSKTAFFAGAFLTTNAFYLTISISCSFAIIKRGMFISLQRRSDESCVLIDWERFVRHNPAQMSFLSWNVDNHYVTVLNIAIVASSIVVAAVGSVRLGATDNVRDWCLILIPLFAHVIPAWGVWQLSHLLETCYEADQNSPAST